MTERSDAPHGEWFVDLCVSHGTESRQAFTLRLLDAWPKIKAALLSETQRTYEDGLEDAAKLMQDNSIIFSCCQQNCRGADRIRALKKAAPQGRRPDIPEREPNTASPAESAHAAPSCVERAPHMVALQLRLDAKSWPGDHRAPTWVQAAEELERHYERKSE